MVYRMLEIVRRDRNSVLSNRVVLYTLRPAPIIIDNSSVYSLSKFVEPCEKILYKILYVVIFNY